ncbi:MAG: luciferase family protein [Nocardioidaceae bacterium]
MDLPRRIGDRPRATAALPHSQLDQQPASTRDLDSVLAEAAQWPHVTIQPSRIAVEGSRALVLSDDADTGPTEAFMIGREFCHGHAGGDSSMHAALPPQLARAAQQAGWGEPHYLVHTHQAPPSITMLYAPRDEAERDVILRLVRASYEFALGVVDRADAGMP